MHKLDDIGFYEQDSDSFIDDDVDLSEGGESTAVGLMDPPDEELDSIAKETENKSDTQEPDNTIINDLLKEIDPEGQWKYDVTSLSAKEQEQTIAWIHSNMAELTNSLHAAAEQQPETIPLVAPHRAPIESKQPNHLERIVNTRLDYLSQIRTAREQALKRYKSRKSPRRRFVQYLQVNAKYLKEIQSAIAAYKERLQYFPNFNLGQRGTFSENLPDMIIGWRECKEIESKAEQKRDGEIAKLAARLEGGEIISKESKQANYVLHEEYKAEIQRAYKDKLGFSNPDPRISRLTTAVTTLNRFLYIVNLKQEEKRNSYDTLLGAAISVAGHYKAQRLGNDVNLFEETDAMLLAAQMAKDIVIDHQHTYSFLRESGLEFMKKHLSHDYHSMLAHRSPSEANFLFHYLTIQLIEKGYLVATIDKKKRFGENIETVMLDVNKNFLPPNEQPFISSRRYCRVTGHF